MKYDPEFEKVIEMCVKMIREGYKRDKIFSRIPSKYDKYEVYEIARCRINIKSKFSRKNLFFDSEGLRYSTPEIVGLYRANKIRNLRIADVSCGCGMQAIFFSLTNEKVLGIDLNPKRIKYAQLNAFIYGVENIEFKVMDALSRECVEITKEYDLIFSDPSREASEKERKLESLSPSPLKIIEKYGERRYLFDLPPQIRRDKIPKKWNLEYLSLNLKINRLSAIVDESCEGLVSAVALPSGAKIEGNRNDDSEIVLEKNILAEFIYEVDECIYYSGLLSKLLDMLNECWYISIGKRRTLMSSERLIENAFLRPYRLVGYASSIHNIVEILRKHEFGRVTPRIPIDPSQYWNFRNSIERKLEGTKKAYIFRVGDKYLICETIPPQQR